MTLFWEENDSLLNKCLAHINAGRSKTTTIFRCREYFEALNCCCQSYSNDESGSLYSSLGDLLVNGCSDGRFNALCASIELHNLASIEPLIMDQEILNERNYDPNNIAKEMEDEAQKSHLHLIQALKCFKTNIHDKTAQSNLLRSTARLLRVIDSNFSLTELTSRGPDIHKVQRDRKTSNRVIPLIEKIFELLFDKPDNRLAMYGTLRRGEVNHYLIEDLAGRWTQGEIDGVVGKLKGYPRLSWILSSDKVKVDILETTALGARFERLDIFEGIDYERVWIPVQREEKKLICNIYCGKQATYPLPGR